MLHPPVPLEPTEPTLTWAGDRFLRIGFGDTPDEAAGDRVRRAHRALNAASLPGVIDLTPAYTTLLATFDLALMAPDIEVRVRRSLANAPAIALASVRAVDVPVCYGGTFGEDLAALAESHGLSVGQAVELHSRGRYEVAFIGFTPGFAYIRGLPVQLATPRLTSPRPRVPAGSIGIAGGQTGVYPGGTPGGWRLIGRTPLRVFDPAREHPSLLAMGDRVRFVPISESEFDRLNEHPTQEGR